MLKARAKLPIHKAGHIRGPSRIAAAKAIPAGGQSRLEVDPGKDISNPVRPDA